jgi:hypothetical protein
MHMSVCSNWTSAKLLHPDFSAALTHEGNSVSFAEQGRPSYIQNCFDGVHLSNFMIVAGKYSSGGYWLTAVAKAKNWAKIEQAINQSGYSVYERGTANQDS